MIKKHAFVSICAASALFATNPLAEAVAAVTSKPNIVTIVIDDMGFSDMGYFGGEAQTPNMDALASGGVALTNFYAAPTSTPSRAQFFTGRDHHMVGVGNMGGLMAWSGDTELMQQPGYEGFLSKDVPLIAEVLQKNGYQTMMTGKWDMGEENPSQYPRQSGFEVTKGLLLPGGDVHYLSDANGNLLTTQPPGYYAKYGRSTPYMENDEFVTSFPANAYSTEYYTDSAIAMLQNRDTNRPFYLNIAHIAPHTPWQAPPEVTAKYIEIYMKGWDVLRQERFERQKASGIVPQDAELPPRRAGLRAWDSLTSTQQKVEANKMAVYAAMVEMVDKSVGRLVQHLKDTGQYENTVFLLYSDNGGESSNVSMLPGPQRTYIMSKYKTPESPDFDPNNYQNMGDSSWVVSPNPEWAMLMNTPFNRHKVNLFDGGYHVPALIHYPQAKVKGVKYYCMQSVMDFAPTMLDMAQVPYPTTWNGKPLAPLQGESMSGLFNGNFSCNADRVLATEFDGMKAVRHAGWALSQGRFDDTWYLFNLEQDPFESKDLKSQHPAKFAELVGYYEQYVKENRVYEVSAKYLQPLVDNSATASITGGTSVNGMIPWAIQTSAKTTDYVDMSCFVRVAPEDVGKMGEVFAYGRFTPAGGGEPVYFDMSEDRIGFRPDMAGLRNFAPKPLPTSKPLPIYQGMIPVPGQVDILVGYRVGDNMVYNSELVTLTVSAN